MNWYPQSRYEQYYALPIGRKKNQQRKEVSLLYFMALSLNAVVCTQDEEDIVNKKRSNHVQRKISSHKSQAKVDPHVEEQFLTGRLLGKLVSSREVSVCG